MSPTFGNATNITLFSVTSDSYYYAGVSSSAALGITAAAVVATSAQLGVGAAGSTVVSYLMFLPVLGVLSPDKAPGFYSDFHAGSSWSWGLLDLSVFKTDAVESLASGLPSGVCKATNSNPGALYVYLSKAGVSPQNGFFVSFCIFGFILVLFHLFVGVVLMFLRFFDPVRAELGVHFYHQLLARLFLMCFAFMPLLLTYQFQFQNGATMMTLAIGFLICMVSFIIAMLMIVYTIFKRNQYAEPRIVARYGFLYNDFLIGCQYYFITDIIRDFTQGVLLGLLVCYQFELHLSIMGLYVLDLIICSLLRPYVYSFLTRARQALDIFKLLQLSIELVLGASFVGTTASKVLSLTSIILSVLFVVVVVAKVALTIRIRKREQTQKKLALVESNGLEIDIGSDDIAQERDNSVDAHLDSPSFEVDELYWSPKNQKPDSPNVQNNSPK